MLAAAAAPPVCWAPLKTPAGSRQPCWWRLPAAQTCCLQGQQQRHSRQPQRLEAAQTGTARASLPAQSCMYMLCHSTAELLLQLLLLLVLLHARSNSSGQHLAAAAAAVCVPSGSGRSRLSLKCSRSSAERKAGSRPDQSGGAAAALKPCRSNCSSVGLCRLCSGKACCRSSCWQQRQRGKVCRAGQGLRASAGVVVLWLV